MPGPRDHVVVGTTSIAQRHCSTDSNYPKYRFQFSSKKSPSRHRSILNDEMKGTRVFAVIAAVVILLAGCEKKSDPIAHAERQGEAKGFSAPSIAETKAIAEEGFIYGLPIVMNYAVMYEYAVDTKSSQYKAPLNQIYNMHRVTTYEDTAVITPNSDTPCCPA